MEPAGKDLASRAINPTTGLVDDAALQYDLLRRMKPSVLTTSVGGHWTLAVPAYTQITSPIRRYADLLMHQQLSAFLKTGRPAFTAARLEGQLTELFRRQAMVRRVEQESRRFWALRYLEQNPGQELEGTVLREVGKKTLVELSPIAIHELIQLRRRRQPGQKIRFEVIEVSSRNDAITLKELG
jgi:exoribonuclease-2